MRIKKNGKVINLTESDLRRIVKRVLVEQEVVTSLTPKTLNRIPLIDDENTGQVYHRTKPQEYLPIKVEVKSVGTNEAGYTNYGITLKVDPDNEYKKENWTTPPVYTTGIAQRPNGTWKFTTIIKYAGGGDPKFYGINSKTGTGRESNLNSALSNISIDDSADALAKALS